MTKRFCDICETALPPTPTTITSAKGQTFEAKLKGAEIEFSLKVPCTSKFCDFCDTCLIEIVTKGVGGQTPPEKTPFQLSADDRIGILDSAIKEVTDEAYKAACEAESNLTRDQFVEALMQAIKAGDFIRYCQQGHNAQAIVYIPYAKQQQLEANVELLAGKLTTAVALLDRVQPATLDRGFLSASLEKLCADIKEFKEGVAQ